MQNNIMDHTTYAVPLHLYRKSDSQTSNVYDHTGRRFIIKHVLFFFKQKINNTALSLSFLIKKPFSHEALVNKTCFIIINQWPIFVKKQKTLYWKGVARSHQNSFIIPLTNIIDCKQRLTELF